VRDIFTGGNRQRPVGPEPTVGTEPRPPFTIFLAANTTGSPVEMASSRRYHPVASDASRGRGRVPDPQQQQQQQQTQGPPSRQPCRVDSSPSFTRVASRRWEAMHRSPPKKKPCRGSSCHYDVSSSNIRIRVAATCLEHGTTCSSLLTSCYIRQIRAEAHHSCQGCRSRFTTSATHAHTHTTLPIERRRGLYAFAASPPLDAVPSPESSSCGRSLAAARIGRDEQWLSLLVAIGMLHAIANLAQREK